MLRFQNLSEVSKTFRISRKSLKSLLESGEIRGRQLPNGHIIIDTHSLTAYLEGDPARVALDLIKADGVKLTATMELFQRENGIWYVRFSKTRKKSLKTRNEGKARKAFKELQKEYHKGRVVELGGSSNKTLGEYRDEYLPWAEKVQKHSTYRANRLALSKLVDIAGEGIKLDRLTHKHLDRLVAKEKDAGNATTSINNYIRHARTSLNKAVAWEYIRKNPFQGYEQFTETDGREPAYLTREEITRLLQSIQDVYLRRFVVAYLVTGRRRSELVFLRWEDVNFERGTYTVRVSKGGTKSFYMDENFVVVLKAIGVKEKGRVFPRWEHPDTVSHRIKEALTEAGFPDLRLHDLRHTYGTLKLQETGNVKLVQALMGHKDLKSTLVYTHVLEDELKKVAGLNVGPFDLGPGIGEKRKRK